jgi:hypothetical protein
MQFNKKIDCVRIGFACLGAFAALDAVMLLSPGGYRDALGQTDGVFDSFNIGRIVIDGSMIVFYRWVYLKMREGIVLPRVMLCHGLLFGFLGLALFIPFLGIFFAPLTPVCALYLGSIRTPFGYGGMLGVAGVFVVFNIYLIWAGLTSTRSVVSRPSVS